MNEDKYADRTFRFVCRDCGEALDVHEDNGFFWHDEYHSCFGEKVLSVAMVDENRIKTTLEGINIEIE